MNLVPHWFCVTTDKSSAIDLEERYLYCLLLTRLVPPWWLTTVLSIIDTKSLLITLRLLKGRYFDGDEHTLAKPFFFFFQTSLADSDKLHNYSYLQLSVQIGSWSRFWFVLDKTLLLLTENYILPNFDMWSLSSWKVHCYSSPRFSAEYLTFRSKISTCSFFMIPPTLPRPTGWNTLP